MCGCVHTVCVYCVCVFLCWINHVPVESRATAAVKTGSGVYDGGRYGGLLWDVGSECLLFAIIVVIMAGVGIIGVCAPAGFIITIPPCCSFSACQFIVQSPLKNFPRCQASSFPLPSVFPSFFFAVCSYALGKCVDTMCVCMCWEKGGSVKQAAQTGSVRLFVP